MQAPSSIWRSLLVFSGLLAVVFFGPTVIAYAQDVMSPTTAQQVAANAKSAVEHGTDASEWGNSFIWAMFSSALMQFVKKHPKLSWFTERTEVSVQRVIAGVVAIAGGLGIGMVFDHDAGVLTVSGLTLASVYHAARQFALQEFVYQATKPHAPKPLV